MTETRTCQNCKTNFTVELADFEFYEKMQVPAPTWCPQCRLVRRMVFCNERSLYQGVCAMCKKNMITMYAPESPHTVYCYECWQSDKWDAASYATEIDPAKPFLAQFAELKKRVPRMGLVKQGDMATSQYCNRASNNRNCYLCFRASNNEDCYYCHYLIEAKDCADCFNVNRCELCYGCVDCFDCYNVRFSQESQNCSDSAFLYDCRNCQDCFGCVNLRNKRNCIFNVQYSTEEYREKIKEWNLADAAVYERAKKESERVFARGIRPFMVSIRSENSTGNMLYGCGNTKDAYMCTEVENGKHLVFITRGKDLMDVFHFGFDIEQVYESANIGIGSSHIKFSNECFTSNNNLEYCDNCIASSDCFGCIGLKKKKYHILNRPYGEEEYRVKVKEIKTRMAYGEFFPPELSSFAYNETVAQMYFPSSKEETLARGFRWRDFDARNISATIKSGGLPSALEGAIQMVGHGATVGCAHEGGCSHECTGVFKAIPQELDYYRRTKVAFPRLCPNCRHGMRLEARTPMLLHARACMCAGGAKAANGYTNQTTHAHGSGACGKKFETTYPPSSPAVVYCEECYQSEVV